MIRRLLDRLDTFGTDDPDFHEGQPEDRCPVCEWPTIDHPGHERWNGRWTTGAAKWPHRRAAAVALLIG
ncbi:hypothetical protein [Mycolicibacterium komossense]|uniref:Uncharacterized protein n=1 Tax=Mycolicibacterium komossense TaxID=1779 RepID=A0ABT3C990_9MYCO|nr:hypothetical protein [Mycolicibacterium komossense]MCV7226049.1 hypothetical protein [Mycolicibacterium komossense]